MSARRTSSRCVFLGCLVLCVRCLCVGRCVALSHGGHRAAVGSWRCRLSTPGKATLLELALPQRSRRRGAADDGSSVASNASDAEETIHHSTVTASRTLRKRVTSSSRRVSTVHEEEVDSYTGTWWRRCRAAVPGRARVPLSVIAVVYVIHVLLRRRAETFGGVSLTCAHAGGDGRTMHVPATAVGNPACVLRCARHRSYRIACVLYRCYNVNCIVAVEARAVSVPDLRRCAGRVYRVSAWLA